MAWWWVNHKQTRDTEVGGNYLWSPKRDSNGARNATYDNMAIAKPGDFVISYGDQQIGAVGIVQEPASDAPRPVEFGTAGTAWSDTGWIVPVHFTILDHPIFPKLAIERIRPFLPKFFSPLQTNGNGNQKFYLLGLSEELATQLLGLSNDGAQSIIGHLQQSSDAAAQEVAAEVAVRQDRTLSETQKEQLIRARRGQGVFRARLSMIEASCRVTGVQVQAHLIASHIKPWRYATNDERLDGNNGLLLAPHVDHLFDHGYISFEGDGTMLIADGLSTELLKAWGLTCACNVGRFNRRQQTYLCFHRDHIFRRSGKAKPWCCPRMQPTQVIQTHLY